jgi:hypothetical protein
MIPIVLDFITIFCLVGGCFLLWLNLRPRRRDIIITRVHERDQSKPPGQDPQQGRRKLARDR